MCGEWFEFESFDQSAASMLLMTMQRGEDIMIEVVCDMILLQMCNVHIEKLKGVQSNFVLVKQMSYKKQ